VSSSYFGLSKFGVRAGKGKKKASMALDGYYLGKHTQDDEI
tara:strand:- start:470 stop:592 length:123 start_codon:yes stop_codon:yes gene_type:complete